MGKHYMVKALASVVILFAALTATSQVSGGVMYQGGYLRPFVTSIVWEDNSHRLFGGTVGVDALLGWNVQTDNLLLGYQLRWSVPLNETTSLFAGVAYADTPRNIHIRDAWDKLGLTFGFTLKQ